MAGQKTNELDAVQRLPSHPDHSILHFLQSFPRYGLSKCQRLGCGRSAFTYLALCLARTCPSSREKKGQVLAYMTGFIFGAFMYVCVFSMTFAVNYKGNIYAILDAKTDSDRVKLVRESTNDEAGGEGFRIPQILHQGWETEEVPEEFLQWMGSWQKHNPHWNHNFWTQNGVDQMIRDVFPSLYSNVYNNYTTPLHRYLVSRYFILHQHGGVYVNLDMENTRTLDPLLKEYSCIVTEEPLAHRVVLYNNSYPNYIVNSFFACRKGHPFLKFILEMLETYKQYDVQLEPIRERVEKSVGSLFLGDIYQLYKAAYNVSRVEDSVYIVPSELLLPNYNERFRLPLILKCVSQGVLNPQANQVCTSLKQSDFSNKLPPGAFCKCNWIDLHNSQVIERLALSMTRELGKVDFKDFSRK